MTVLLAALLLSAAPPPDVFASCAWVRAENDGAGTGFVIDREKRWLITCRHVVANHAVVDVYFPWHRDGVLISDRKEYLRSRPRLRELGLLVNGTVRKRFDAADLALVELDSVPPSVKAAMLGPAVDVGTPLRVVGNRLDLDTLWNVTTGPVRVSGRLTNGYTWRATKLAANANVIIGQLPIEAGDSGGPVLNTRGEIVGMVSALRRQTPLAAVVVSAAEIRRFLDIPASTATVDGSALADTLSRATVWVRPTATNFHTAGVLIDRVRGLVLTSARGIGTESRVGVAFALRQGEHVVGERAPYRDSVGLHLHGAWRSGVVLGRDLTRDLALIQLDSIPDGAKAVPLAVASPTVGDAVHTMNHPAGLEFMWVYAAGSVRQRGRVTLAEGEDAPSVAVTVLQVPAQAGSPGGPVLNDRGELLGVLAVREGSQLVGYAATGEEIRHFLDVTLADTWPRTWEGAMSRLGAVPDRVSAAFARAFAARAEQNRQAGRMIEAVADCDTALSLDSACLPARLCRARMFDAAGRTADAIAELDAADRGPFDRAVLVYRAALAARLKDWRTARGRLERVLDVDPADAGVRQRLAGVLLELGQDEKAAVAVADTLRADPKRLQAVAADLLTQGDALAKRFPDTPSTASDWLGRALWAVEKTTADTTLRARLAEALKRAVTSIDDKAKFAILRGFVANLAREK